MLEALQEIDHQSLSELRQRHDSGRKALAELSEELDRTFSEMKAKTELLTLLNREYAVTERQIKESRNEIFLIKKNCTELNEDSLLLRKEFKRTENLRAHFRGEKQNISDSIAGIEKELCEVPSTLGTLEKERQALHKRVEERSGVKQGISEEISSALSKASLDRDEIEPQLVELNTAFLSHMTERGDTQNRLSETEAATKGLVEDIGDLQQQIESLEHVGELQGKRNSLKAVVMEHQQEVEALRSTLEELKEELSRKQEQFNAFEKTNGDRREEIASLEKEVSDYDEALKQKKMAQEERDSTFKMTQQGLEALMELFTNKTKLESELLMMRQKIKVMAELVKSIG
jgi:chromosome segregation ATPase